MKATAIIADAEPRIGGELATRLQGKDFEVFRATSVPEALARAEGTQTDVCLIDLDVPVADGWGAVSRLRQLRPALRVIGLTERSDMAQCACQAHLSGLAEKPLDYGKLLSVIETMLGQREVSAGLCYVPARAVTRIRKHSVQDFEPMPCLSVYSGWGINE